LPSDRRQYQLGLTAKGRSASPSSSAARRIMLWTQSNLIAARKIYQDAGFALVKTEPHRSFGQNLIGETWEMKL
jgi:hypothetical protein